jgi:hypothetical protein
VLTSWNIIQAHIFLTSFFSSRLSIPAPHPRLHSPEENSGYPPPPSPHESLESAGSHEIARKIRMAKKLDIKIRETKELAVDGLISIKLSRPAPSLRG